MKRVAAYCRVSTDDSDQANSLASQERYFREYIARNPEWELAEIYVDEGITGTSTKKRAAFNRMIAAATSHSFELILTKEISRFARNTLDSIYYTRKLKEHGVGVLFMNDNINTLDADAELRLTIMSSIAQEESRKTSERVKWGQKRRMEQGVVFGRDMLGYDVRDGKLFINQEGAEVVRLIFHKFVTEGKGTHVIAKELRQAGIKTATYMKQWSNTVILRVIRNEKYCGDLIQKKTYTPNYLSHDKKYNRGEVEFVVLRDHHEPIITRELFDRAQEELQRRAPSEEQKKKHSNRYCFSGKIKCGACGNSYVSRTKKRKDGSVYKAWRCLESARHGARRTQGDTDEIGCDSMSLNDEDLKQMMQQVIKSLLFDKQGIINRLTDVIGNVLSQDMGIKPETTKQEIEKIDAKRQRLLELFVNADITKADFQRLKQQYDKTIENLKKELKEQDDKNKLRLSQQFIYKDIASSIRGLIIGDTWDDTFYRNLLDQIVVQSDGTLEITLKLLPNKWHAVLHKAIAAMEQPCAAECHFDASVPTSVSIALPSL